MMNCDRAIELLPSHAVGALSDRERVLLEEHLGSGCPSCLQELDEMTAAASLLAESVDSAALRAEVKIALLDRIDSMSNSVSLSPLPNKTLVAKRHWKKYLPYIAATLCATAFGTWTGRQGEQPRNESADEWRQRIAAAEQEFGAPRIRLAKLEAEGQGLSVVVFYDGLSGESHVLVTNTAPPSQGQQLWLWLIDRQGARLSQGPLEYLGQGHAASVFDLSTATGTIPETVFEVIITDEPGGDHAEPTGPVVGVARLSRSS